MQTARTEDDQMGLYSGGLFILFFLVFDEIKTKITENKTKMQIKHDMFRM